MYPQFQGVGAITVYAQFIIFLQTLHGAYCWMGPRTNSYQHAHHCMTRATLSFSDDDDAVYCMHMRRPTCNARVLRPTVLRCRAAGRLPSTCLAEFRLLRSRTQFLLIPPPTVRPQGLESLLWMHVSRSARGQARRG